MAALLGSAGSVVSWRLRMFRRQAPAIRWVAFCCSGRVQAEAESWAARACSTALAPLLVCRA